MYTILKKHIALALLACLLATTVAFAQDASSEAEKPAVPTYTSINRLPGHITLATLSNGLTVIVQENHSAPVATVRCTVKNTGSAFEGRYLGAGISHVLEHVVSGGTTTRRTEKEIEKIIDTFGGATNAFTSTNMTSYYIDCPAANAPAAIDLIADAMQHVKFEPNEFARELKVVRRELADGEVSRRRVLWKMLRETVYTKHPIRYPIIGYLDVLNATTNESIIDFYRRRYVPNNQVFVVAGDVDTQKVLDQIAAAYTGTPRGFETFVPLPEEPEQLSPREAVREMDGATYDLALCWPTVELSHPDLYALDVAAYILAEGESSRLARRLKYERQLALSVNSASSTPSYARGFFAVFAVARPDTWQEARDEILREVYKMREQLVDPDELAKAKKQKAAELVFQQQTVQSSADSMARSYISTGDPLFDKVYVENIQKVTAEQIRDVARRYFDPQRLSSIIIAPPGGAPKSADDKHVAGGGEVQQFMLDNGVRVLVKQDSRLPMVNMQAYVMGGLLVDTPQTAGRSALLAKMLDKGTANYTAEQIADYFDSIGGQISMGSGRNTVYGSITTLSDDFPRSAALFAECFTRPSFPESEFAKVKTLALGSIARRASIPHSEIMELFADTLPPTTPYHIVQGGKKETVERLSAADMKAYHRRYFVPANMVVTIFGDVDPKEAMTTAKRLFGGLKPDPSFKPISFDRDNSIAKDVTRHKKIGKETGMVLLGYPAPGILDKKDNAAIVVLDAIMSGYGYPGGWLHNELRGEGLVYYVHAFQINGPAPGYLAFMAQTHPDKVKEVVGRIEAAVDRARSGKITPEEFKTAVNMIVALHAQENTTIASQSQLGALNELYGLGYDYDKSFDARIKAVTI